MAKFDPTRQPSPRLTQQALADYGSDPAIVVPFVRLVAAGYAIGAAYSALHPDASPATISKQASVLAAHPSVRRRIVLAGLPPRERMAELVPTALEVLLDVLENGTPTERVRAANSVLDRGGVPRSSQVETSLRADLQLSGKALLELAAKLPSVSLPPGPRPAREGWGCASGGRRIASTRVRSGKADDGRTLAKSETSP